MVWSDIEKSFQLGILLGHVTMPRLNSSLDKPTSSAKILKPSPTGLAMVVFTGASNRWDH
jgi:hypothetical protein